MLFEWEPDAEAYLHIWMISCMGRWWRSGSRRRDHHAIKTDTMLLTINGTLKCRYYSIFCVGVLLFWNKITWTNIEMKNHESVNQFLYDPSRTEQPVRLTAETTIPAQVFLPCFFFRLPSSTIPSSRRY